MELLSIHLSKWPRARAGAMASQLLRLEPQLDVGELRWATTKTVTPCLVTFHRILELKRGRQ